MLKTVSSVANALGALNYKGTWNASTNTPTLASGVGTQGDYYVVSVDGTTDLDGITNWGVGDWAAFNGSVWQRVEGGADGNFVQLTVSGNADVEGDVTAGNQALLKTVTSEYSMEVGGQYGKMVGTKTGSGVGGLEFYSYSGGLYKTADLTNSGNLNLTTGNLIVSSGAGIDFSATAQAPGSTSELFSDYEEGNWDPELSSAGGAFTSVTFSSSIGKYTKIGRAVYVRGSFFTLGAITVGAASGQVYITGLPFAVGETGVGNVWFNPDSANYNQPTALATGCTANSTRLQLFKNGTINNPAFVVTELYTGGGPGNNYFFEATYQV